MLGKIAAFEARYQLRSPLFFVGFALFFLLTFGATTNDHIHIGSIGNVNRNSPFAILEIASIMNVFGVFVLVAFVANVIIRDDDTGFAPIIRATRITKFDYLVGRFIGAYLVAIIVMTSVPLAILIGSWMPWLDQEKIGPTIIAHYLYALFVFTAPTVLAMGAGFFALATITRSMMWSYVGAVGFLVLYAASQILLSDPSRLTEASLADPFGTSAIDQVTRYWTAADRNTQLPAIAGVILANRLIWLAAGVGMFALAYSRFRFDTPGSKHSKSTPKDIVADAPEPVTLTHGARSSSAPSAWRQFIAITRFDMGTVFKSPAFFVLLAIGVLNSLAAMIDTAESRGTHYFPVTRAIVDALSGSFTFFPIVIAIYYAGELVWRDRDQRIHEIVDATAAPSWAFMVPKVIGISLVLLACFVVGVLSGCAFQLAHGYSHFELGAYLRWFVVPEASTAILLAALAMFVQTLAPHKAVGWAVMLVYIVSNFALPAAGFEHNLYLYARTSIVPLSDMNGMGRFWVGFGWFQAYWTLFALLLLVASQLLWRRGVDTSLRPRLKRLPQRFIGATRWVACSAAVAWLGIGTYVFYNTNILNEYRTQPETDQWTADYEKALLPFELLPQPRIAHVQLAVNLEPRKVRATTIGSYVIENRTGLPLSDLHVRWIRPLQMQSLEVPDAKLSKEFADYQYRIYTFTTPMLPGEKRTIRFATLLEQQGFANRTNLTRIVENGTFLDNYEIAPIIGMSRDRLLQDRSKRRKFGLPAELRPAKLEDPTANAHQYLRNDSDWVTADLQLTTDADQTPVAPGYLVSDTVTGNRRTLVTRTEAPIMHFVSFQSARYAEMKDAWKRPDGSVVNLSVYYHPAHDHNAQRMLYAMKVSLALFGEKFSPYQFRQARILEFPAYERFAQSFANTFPYSEAIGFVQNHDDARNDEQIDLVTYVTAHEVAHQWWGDQIIGADKQGMTLLSETFAQYSALLVMENLYGKEQVRKFLKTELDSYLRNRGGEVVEELPLARVENQAYIHYRKGALAMYWLKEAVGEETVNRSLRVLLKEFAFKPAPYPSSSDFIRLLRAEAGPEQDGLISDLFEKITLYDMKATEAVATQLPDGKYRVTFKVDGKKVYADGQGKETEATLSEPFDIGVFTDEPGKKGYTRESVIHLDRRLIHGGQQSIEVIVDREPKYVGVDPFNMRIDRNSDDNLTLVTIE